MTSNRVLVECFNGHSNTIDVAELNMHQSRCCAVCDQPLRYPLSQIIEEAFGDAVAFRPTGWRENEPAYRLPTAEEAKTRLLTAIAEHGYLTRASAASPSKRVERLEAATRRHVKRGTEYTLIAIATWVSIDPAKDDDDAYVAEVAPGVWHARWAFAPQDPKAEWARVQANEPFGVGAVLAVYRSVTDGSLWVRPREEFEDGRFQALGGRS